MNSNNQVFKVAFAIFVGAFIGSFFGLYYFGHTVWSLLVGMTVGALVGYVSYEPVEFYHVIIRAWKEADITKWVVFVVSVPLCAILICLWAVDCMMSMLLTILPVLALSGFVAYVYALWLTQMQFTDVTVLVLIMSTLIACFMSLFRSIEAMGIKSNEPLETILSIHVAKSDWPRRFGIILLESLPLVSIPRSALAIYWFCALHSESIRHRLYIAMVSVYKFFVLLVKYAHCEGRVQAATYSVIGVAIGWYMNSPLAGAIIGATLGALGYQFITRRFLKQAVEA